MSRFGIRKKVKGALKKMVAGEPSAGASAPPTPARPAKAASPSPASPPPPKAPTPPKPPKAPPAPSKGAPAASKASPPDTSQGTTWVQAAGVKPDEVVPGTAHAVQIFGNRYALYKTDDGNFYATSDSCPHAGGPLAEGELDGFEVTCPFHSWTFDVRDGSCTSGESLDVQSAAVRVSDEMVFVEVGL